jgi:hypothetical protein
MYAYYYHIDKNCWCVLVFVKIFKNNDVERSVCCHEARQIRVVQKIMRFISFLPGQNLALSVSSF